MMSDQIKTVGVKEAALYDRQIRVWGLEAQRRLQNAKILICNINGINLEVAKNLSLAGINLVLQDSRIITSAHLCGNYFISEDSIGLNMAKAVSVRVQELNQFVSVSYELTPLKDLNESFFSNFSAVILSDCSDQEAITINQICRQNNISFFWTGSIGLEGWFVVDLGDSFQYQNDQNQINKEIQCCSYSNLEVVLNKKWCELAHKLSPISKTFVKSRLLSLFREYNNGQNPSIHNKDNFQLFLQFVEMILQKNGLDKNFVTVEEMTVFCQMIASQVLSVNSIIGGFLSQDVIKVISRIGSPIQNVFVFDANDCIGRQFNTSL